MSSEGPGISTRDIDPRSLSLHSHPSDDICGHEEQEKEVPAVSTRDIASQIGLPQVADDDLDDLIAELEQEDGKAPDPEELPTGTSRERSIDPQLLQTDRARGLSDIEIVAARRKYGWNRIKLQKPSHLKKFFNTFVGPVQFVMEAAAILAAGLQDWIDFGIITGLLWLNAAVSFVQEFHAGNIVDSLKKTLALNANVIRNGALVEVEAEEVVPGDVVEVDTGTIIPADGIIVSDDTHLQIDQSALTGESLAVDKFTGDHCFASSAVKRGAGTVIATAIGHQTFVGTAAALANEADDTTGHFTLVLNDIGLNLLKLVTVCVLLVWVAAFYRSVDIRQILEFTLAIVVIGVPVGLPAVVTTTMAVGAWYLGKEGAVIQQLAAIESLAGVEILCTDKTGTLTRNRLALGELWLAPGADGEDLMLAACLAATRRRTGSDAIDRVFIKALRNYPRAKSQIASFSTVEFSPFDPVSKRVTALVESGNGERMTCVKGAPKVVMEMVEAIQPVPKDTVTAYREKVAEFAGRGFRSLGVARKNVDGQWQILGIMSCSDPPRHDTAKTIREAQSLGLRIKMLTGDAVGIARETARQLGMGTNIYNAERLGLTGAGDMPGSEVADFVEAADGFAEVYPEHKYKVVEILQKRGYLVAMTGDGVNDAPSLKKADTGIAVEGASDAANSAADIVFTHPGLSAIITAIKTARQIFHRMFSYLIYRIALSMHLLLFFGLWILTMNEVLDLRLVVILAIFADIATLAIAYDNAPYSQTPVKWNLPKTWGVAVIEGCILAGGSWIAFGTMLLRGEQAGLVQNFGSRDGVLFLEIALTQNWLIFITRRTRGGPFWKQLPSLQLTLAVLLVDVAATLMIVFGVFVSRETDWVTIIRIWVFSLGMSIICGIFHVWLQNSETFDNLMHGRLFHRRGNGRAVEDFLLSLQRVSTQHEKAT